MVIKDRSRKRRRRRREAGMRIRKEAIWPTECPVRTRYKGFLYLFYSGFRLFHSSILRDSFPIRSRLSNPLDVFRLRSSLDCESYVLESVGYVTRRKRKLDFPAGTWCAASSRWSALFQLPIRRRHDSRDGERFFFRRASCADRGRMLLLKEREDSNK